MIFCCWMKKQIVTFWETISFLFCLRTICTQVKSVCWKTVTMVYINTNLYWWSYNFLFSPAFICFCILNCDTDSWYPCGGCGEGAAGRHLSSSGHSMAFLVRSTIPRSCPWPLLAGKTHAGTQCSSATQRSLLGLREPLCENGMGQVSC